jgi:hypothetical protein
LGHFAFARLAKFAKLANLGKIQISAVQITTELKRAIKRLFGKFG